MYLPWRLRKWASRRPLLPEHVSPSFNQYLKSQTATPPPPPPPQLPFLPAFYNTLQEVQDDILRPLRVLEEYGRQQQSVPPSPEMTIEEEFAHLERQEDAARRAQEASDRNLAMRLSQEDDSLPPPSPPHAGPSRLRSLSLSPDPPALLLPARGRADAPAITASTQLRSLSLSPNPPLLPARGRADAPIITGKARRKRLPAASAPSRTRSAPFKITTQLNDTWISLNSRSASPLEPIAAVSPTPSSVFFVRSGATRRAFADPRQVERFTLVFLTGGDPQILSVDASQIQEVRWPAYQLSADKKTCDTLGSDLAVDQLDTFLSRQRVWMGITIDYIHTVSTDCALILRPRGMYGPQDDDTIERFLPESSPPHLRHNLPAERRAVRTKLKTLKGKAKVKIFTSDSESEGEVEITAVSIMGKRRVEDEDSPGPPRPHQRPRLMIDTALSSAGSSPSRPLTLDSPTSPPPSALSLASVSHSSASEPPTPVLDYIPTSAIRPAKWPEGMFTVDVVNGFLQMASEDLAKMNREARFVHVFKKPYKSATYDDNFRRWKNASEDLRRQSLAAGRTEKGLWSAFRAALKVEQASQA
ncbi:hypothetical protein B0H13DRAFT_2497087 [Mycena leptocephala]|nr:hypothetical protein B0H13DRAFT_2497087 [Mycena leptocephala]